MKASIGWGVVSRFATWIRTDWGGLAIIALFTLLRGWAYLPYNTEGHVIPAVERWVPTTWAAVVWIIVGLLGLLAVALRRMGSMLVGVSLGLHTLWALLYLSGWIASESPRGYVTAISYAGFVALVLWAFGSRREVQVKISEGVIG